MGIKKQIDELIYVASTLATGSSGEELYQARTALLYKIREALIKAVRIGGECVSSGSTWEKIADDLMRGDEDE